MSPEQIIITLAEVIKDLSTEIHHLRKLLDRTTEQRETDKIMEGMRNGKRS